MKVASWILAFLVFFLMEYIVVYDGICAKEKKKPTQRGEILSKEDVEVIKNLELLEILNFLEEDPDLLKDLDVIDKRVYKGE